MTRVFVLTNHKGGVDKSTRLQLVDNSRRKHHGGSKLYAIDRSEVLDMMQRYDVLPIENEGSI